MNAEKVVKCNNNQCGLYFGYTEKKTKCPFCHTKYVEKETSARGGSDFGGKEKKGSAKTQKTPFKTWKNPHTN